MEHIIVTRPRPGVMLITLNRPRSLNALNKALLVEVAGALDEAGADADVRAVVLTGDERSFSAGADIKEMPEAGIPPFAQADRLRSWKTIERFPKPLVAAVNGYALGGGFELTLLCDIVIAGENARFGTPEIKIAAFAGDGGTQPDSQGRRQGAGDDDDLDGRAHRCGHGFGLGARCRGGAH